MRVPTLVLKSVGFVAEVIHSDSEGDQYDVVATGFFVSVPGSEPSFGSFLCFVTAKHVASDLKEKDFVILVNREGGGIVSIPRSELDSLWYLHPSDRTADVAVLAFNRQREMDIVPIPADRFITLSGMKQKNIGIGDEVFITGLFTYVPGSRSNMPIVRHGNIAMLPEEQIYTELGFADAYLVEARSIGGLSGSPVFVRETLALDGTTADGQKLELMGLGRTFLLGLMHGHWDVKESDLNKAYPKPDFMHGVNMGIGIVTPTEKILETINRPELQARRAEHEERLRRVRAPVPNTDMRRKSNDKEPSFTKADFEAALKKVARKIEPEK